MNENFEDLLFYVRFKHGYMFFVANNFDMVYNDALQFGTPESIEFIGDKVYIDCVRLMEKYNKIIKDIK